MHKWYVIQVIPGQEKKVKKSLEESRELKGMVHLLSEVLLPMENVAEVRRGEQKVSEKRMWPGYVWLHMELTDDSWMYVKEVAGVIGFLGGKTPVPLSDEEIQPILSDVESRKSTIVHKHNIRVGSRVKVVGGAFANYEGTVLEVFQETGRVSVLVSIFGRDIPISDLELGQVEELLESE